MTTSETADPSQDTTESRVAELEIQLRRALADFENLQKRFDREVRRERTVERDRVARAWLPVVDGLSRFLNYGTANPRPLLDGVRAIRDQAVDILKGLGFTPFEAVGEPFDPMRHEAVGAVSDAAPAGTVVASVQAGYQSTDDILRPARVMVSSGVD